MLPFTYPKDSNGSVVVKNLTSVSGLREWVDYIPVQEVSEVAASSNRYEDDGHIPVTTTIPA